MRRPQDSGLSFLGVKAMAATEVTALWSKDLGAQPSGVGPAMPLQEAPNPWGGLDGFSLAQQGPHPLLQEAQLGLA